VTIMGIDVVTPSPCRCRCTTLRITPYNKKSDKLIFKCAWCKSRKGKPTEAEVEKLESFVKQFGWQWRPLILADNGSIYVR
jgi:hypothetical protein